ncbi:MAG: PEP-CTERM sorting domain-containing protein [Pirellulales bacterium]|nr:PEP-CTERM sorting domain-containing protein [Pirellulales bacterium]
MTKHPCLLALSLAFSMVLVTTSVLGDDLFPPDWRGLPNSTLQIWEFSNNANPAPPTIDQNTYGDPVATIYGEFNYPKKDTFWLAEDFGHDGVWCVGGSISLDIPNDPVARPEKWIRLQIVHDGGLTTPEPQPWIDVVADNGSELIEFTHVQQLIQDEYYVHDTYDLLLEPNPTFETIWILPRYCQIYVDQIVVDTICVPEPSTVIALLVGGLCLVGRAVMRRRRARAAA